MFFQYDPPIFGSFSGNHGSLVKWGPLEPSTVTKSPSRQGKRGQFQIGWLEVSHKTSWALGDGFPLGFPWDGNIYQAISHELNVAPFFAVHVGKYMPCMDVHGFQIFFIVTPKLWGNHDPIWRAYFSVGLKPPTSFSFKDTMGFLYEKTWWARSFPVGVFIFIFFGGWGLTS